MKKTTELYLSHLKELNINKLDGEDIQTLSSCLIRETPTKYIPLFEKYDIKREVMFMMAEWMDDEDNEKLGYEILDKMRNLIMDAMTPLIEDKMEDYRKREELATADSQKERDFDNYIYEKSRI